MKMKRLGIFLLQVLLAVIPGIRTRTNYTGYQLIAASIKTSEQLDSLQVLYNKGDYDFWTDPRLTGEVDIMTSPQKARELKEILSSFNAQYQLKIEDVQSLVDAEQATIDARQLQQEGITWDSYYSYDQIIQWANDLVSSCPGLITNETIGLSTEGRELRLYKLSTGGATNKPAVWIDGTFHAREWISPATVTYVLNELCVNSAAYMEFLNAVDFYIVPFVNPDGYQYSREVTRMWRKTRKDHNSTRGCIGVDPNRNFEFEFGGAGTSTDKCTDIYTGPEPFSEPETRAVRDFLLNSAVNWTVYITVHSYGQYILIPYSYAEDAYPADFNSMLMFAQNSSNAMTSVHGTTFTVGQSAVTLGATAGCSDDWAKAIAGIKYSYTYELRDTGKYGFLLPPEEIRPTCEEFMRAIVYTGRNIAGLEM